MDTTTPSSAAPRLSVAGILEPRSVAVVGASETRAKFGGRIMHHLVDHGYAGDLVPINPGRPAILGRKAYARLADVPVPPEVAILAVPAEALVPNVAAAAEAGVGCCVIISTGFAEAGEDGAAMQHEMVAIARRSGMRLVGPNCMGLIVPHHRMPLCSSVVLEKGRLATGRIGLISQSGALMVSVYDRAATDGVGFRYCVSLGNQADLEICDFLEHMVSDPGTGAICLYVEGFKDGARFRRAALACRAAGKPLLMVKTGRTSAGVKAARSHTASLAGSFEVLEAVCREAGVVLARDPDDMVRAANMLVRHPGPRRPGGVGIYSTSGGGACIASDRLTEEGLGMAALADATRARLGEILLPPQADNPIDIGGNKTGGDITRTAAEILLADPAVAYGLVILTSSPFFADKARILGEVAKGVPAKPCFLAITPGQAGDAPRAALRELDQPYFDRFEDAVRALSLVMQCDRLHALPVARPVRPEGLADSVALPTGAATETEVKRALSACGIRTAREEIVADACEAAHAAARIGFPVVVKAVSRDIAHKSDVGAVAVGLNDAAAVEAAVDAMRARLAQAAPGARIEGFSVQELVRGGAEVIVGVRRDPAYGPVVMVGLGGTAVEILKDIAIAPAPVSADAARRMIGSLRLAPLLHGARGAPPLDIEAIVDAVVRISWMAHDLGHRLVDLEVNPLLVGATGQGAVAVDGRATVAG